ncbi:iron(III) transport system substrate-binding protein [Halogranum gelatinilyticum]|uniref:Iron(III) transport system substrate-binding protein n=1 Tax=Halogranum gelatinilyticum TaxID=660521 RepID=A0A1G9WJ17_9EURY|nr:iron ABC transporter substrate-binding protein [Halogranum gelatinilyticum]SDM84470.1 iron(III) transport system substrate-binding protein [Halogranum gelatinilyticum]
MEDDDGEPRLHSRRRILGASGLVGATALAGCSSFLPSSGGDGGDGGSGSEPVGQIGSGRSPFGDRDISGGVSMAEMPDLEGELTLYSGRGEPLVGTLLEYIEDLYPDFTIQPRYGSAIELVNLIQTEGDNSPADVFYSVNAGALGQLDQTGRTQTLPDEVLDFVPESFRDPDGGWVGTSGRARSVPFNTNEFSESDIPDSVMDFPGTEALRDNVGWAPTYSSFQAFVTAMRILEGEEATREWLQGMQDLGVESYNDEFLVSQAVADGELGAGFANHYYTLRVQAGRADPPISLAFTENDAGAIFNVAGASIVDTAEDTELAANFVRHLLSAEAQDYFARETFEYPLVPEVEPLAELPSIDELNPPEGLDLTQLSDLQGTVELLRDVGVL